MMRVLIFFCFFLFENKKKLKSSATQCENSNNFFVTVPPGKWKCLKNVIKFYLEKSFSFSLNKIISHVKFYNCHTYSHPESISHVNRIFLKCFWHAQNRTQTRRKNSNLHAPSVKMTTIFCYCSPW